MIYEITIAQQDGGSMKIHAPAKSRDFPKSRFTALFIETFLMLYRSCQSIV